MTVETEHGNFEILKNHREAFDLEMFNEKYIDVAFDRYTYLVGDVSAGILRIKGFNSDARSPRGFKAIPDYLNESCNMNAAHFIVKRIRDKETKGKNDTKKE